MIKGKALFAAMAAALLLAAGDAQASFRYSVTTVPTVINFGLSTYTLTGAGLTPTPPATLSGQQNINLVQTAQTSTQSPSTPDSSLGNAVTLTVNVLNVESGISGTFTVNTTLNITRSDSAGAASNLVVGSITSSPSPLVLGSFLYTLSQITYSPPTIGITPQNGGISALITEGPIPEPASLVMLGTGVLAVGGLGVMRRRRQG